jgi:hypothetical protein
VDFVAVSFVSCSAMIAGGGGGGGGLVVGGEW